MAIFGFFILGLWGKDGICNDVSSKMVVTIPATLLVSVEN